MDLSVIDQLYGNAEMGLEWQAKALDRHRAFSANSQKNCQKKLLVFAKTGPMGGNTPIEFLLQNSDFEIITYYPNINVDEVAVLPDHDIAFCAAPVDSENAQRFFEAVRKLTSGSPVKTINLPSASITFERDALEQVFPYIEGLRFPKTTRLHKKPNETSLNAGVEKEILATVGHYPIVIRPVGLHAGVGLAKVHSIDELNSYLSERSEQEFFVSEFINYASLTDGSFRKYRIIFVNGMVFPCHLAISERWDVWYSNSNMHDSNEKRCEEAEFMETFEEAFFERHRDCFEALAMGIELDYFGIDCAEDKDGNLVVFEADNALIVHDMDSETVFPYKQKHMRRIFAAVENMLQQNCGADVESEATQIDASDELKPTKLDA